MGKPHHFPKPDLSRFSSRQIAITSDRNKFEFELFDWMREVVQHTKNPPTIGVSRETELIGTARNSIDVIMQAPASMAINGPGGNKRTVYADFFWQRLPDGHWYVSDVSFHLSLNQHDQRLAQQRALKQRLTEKAEAENASHVHIRKMVFPAEDHVETWPHDILSGDAIIQSAIERAYEHAKVDAATIENPVAPVDMALDMVGLGVGGLKNASEGAEKLGSVYEALDKGRTAKGIGERLKDKEKSTGDKVLETTLDVAAYIPGAGPFIRTIAGMMLEIAIASDASRITKIRSRAYVFFVAGYIGALAFADTGTPNKPFDKKYFDLGSIAAPKGGSPGSFFVQASLMHYASEHYTDGGWGGLSYKKQVWTFPEQYIVKWSPELLGRAFATQLHKRHYLIE